MKSGTCSLRAQLQWMANGDDLSLPSQELHFFDEDEEWARGPAYYASWFEDCSMIGDVTPSYLYIPAAIERLADQLPQAQLVVLLRNPIARAVSHQNHDHDKNRPVGSLSQRYQKEMASYGSPPSRSDAFRRGLYAEQMERLLHFFPADQVLVIIAERYRKQPEKELRRIRAFLGLKSVWFPAEALMEEHVRPEYSELLSAPLREELRRFYAADVQHLRGLLGDPLKDWDADFATFRPPVLLRPRYVVSWLPVGSSTSAESEVSRELVERQRRRLANPLPFVQATDPQIVTPNVIHSLAAGTSGPVIASIPEGAVQDFNMKNPASAVCPNDLILAVNAVEGEVKAIIQQLQSLDKTPLTLKILRPQEMKISMGKKPNASLGLQMNFSSFSAGAVVDMIAESGVAYGWNESQPEEKRLRRGDRLVAIDGQYLKGEEMIEALKQKKGQDFGLPGSSCASFDLSWSRGVRDVS
ncbi:HS3ST6 [Symbiodinium sp. KB8]|nr:HS3ST6 [Symbiodinium sp. KB8]